MNKTFYAKNQEEATSLLNEYSEKGFLFEEKNNHSLHGTLQEDIITYRTKCLSCNEYVTKPWNTHGSRCEHCNELLCLKVKKDDVIRFSLKNQAQLEDFWMYVYEYDAKEEKLYFYANDLPEQGRLFSHPKEEIPFQLVQQGIGTFRTMKGVEVFEVSHSFKDTTKNVLSLSISKNISGYRNMRRVKLYQEKEYSFFQTLPIPDFVTIYKEWEMQKDVRHFLTRNGLSTISSYYSGRGIMYVDLNLSQLKTIHQQVLTYKGTSAAHAFVQMINDIPVLSASTFISAFYALEENEWTWSSSLISQEDNRYDAITRSQSDLMKQSFLTSLQPFDSEVCERFIYDDGGVQKMKFYRG